MKITFRVDASLQIATGHVMRCLTLANALRQRGHDCSFICRDLPGHLGARIEDEGFHMTLLPAPTSDFHPAPDDPAHAAWAAVPWQLDAEQTLAATQICDWLVVDHYAFDARWQREAIRSGTKLAVFDDLADRPHIADLLVDQNLGRRSADYDNLMPTGAERMIGPRHAVLRPEFAALREKALSDRADRGYELRHLLVFMGGMDAANSTAAVLTVLAAQPDLTTTVVMGAAAPALDAIKAQAAALAPPAKVVVNVSDMATLMSQADLAIGAAGGTTWERCTLGLPTLVTVLADNQTDAAAALSAAGAAIDIGLPNAALFSTRLAEALQTAKSSASLRALSQSAAAIADGRGTARVVAALESPLSLRRATMADAEPIWHWRRGLPVAQFRAGATPALQDHLEWFERALTDPTRRLYVCGTPAIGHLRLDLEGDGSAAISIVLALQHRSAGLGHRLLSLLADAARAEGLHTLMAEAHCDNSASIGLFRAAGYTETGSDEGFCRLFRML